MADNGEVKHGKGYAGNETTTVKSSPGKLIKGNSKLSYLGRCDRHYGERIGEVHLGFPGHCSLHEGHLIHGH